MGGVSNQNRTSDRARDAVRDYFAKYPSPGQEPTSVGVNHFCRKLEEAGYIIVDRQAAYAAPKGRGNEAFKKVRDQRRCENRVKAAVARRGKAPVYTGPDMIGTSHTSNLINGGLT